MSDLRSQPITTSDRFGSGVDVELFGDAIDRLLDQTNGTDAEPAARVVAAFWAAARNEIQYLVAATRILGHQVELLDQRARLLRGLANPAD